MQFVSAKLEKAKIQKTMEVLEWCFYKLLKGASNITVFICQHAVLYLKIFITFSMKQLSLFVKKTNECLPFMLIAWKQSRKIKKKNLNQSKWFFIRFYLLFIKLYHCFNRKKNRAYIVRMQDNFIKLV